MLSFVDQTNERGDHLIEAGLQTRADAALDHAKAQLAESDYNHAWAAGQSMSPDDILAFALAA